MKRTLLTLSAAALILGSTSCKKEYTCTCTADFGSMIPGYTQEAKTTIKDTKKKATDKCKANEVEVNYMGYNIKQTCELN